MIALCTGAPLADLDESGTRVIATIPSGRDELQISLSLNEAMRLAQSLLLAVTDGFSAVDQRSVAQVVPFHKPTRRRQA